MKKSKRLLVLAVLVLALLAMIAVGVFADDGESELPSLYATGWSLLPPVIAIVLALITKEVYSSLFIGILVGGLLYSGFSFTGTIEHVFVDGMVGTLSDSWNVGILIFP